jgi:O-antigen ligase
MTAEIRQSTIFGAEQARLWLSLSLALAVTGSIPFSETPDFKQPLLRAMFLLAAWCALVLASGKISSSVTAPWRYFSLPLVSLLTWCAMSILWSVNPAASVVRTIETIITFIYLQSFIFVLAQSSRSVTDCATVMAKSFLLAALCGLFINVLLFGTFFHMWMNPDVPERPRFTFGYLHPLATGDIAAIAIITTLFTRWNIYARLAFVAALYGLLHASDSTGARFSIYALVPIIMLYKAKSQTEWTLKLFAAVALGSLFMLVIVQWVDIDSLQSLNQQSSRLTTLTGRVQIWNAIFENGLASTALGAGFDAGRYVIEPFVGKAYHAHNIYLNVLVELGMIGFALFMFLVASWLTRLAQAGTLLPIILCAYSLLLGISNPGMLTKLSLMLIFMASFILPLFFPRLQPQPEHVSTFPQSAVS